MNVFQTEIRKIKEIEEKLNKKVGTIADATREILSGLPAAIAEIDKFLENSEGYDKLYIMTDTVAFAKIHQKNQALEQKYKSLKRSLEDDIFSIHRKLIDRSHEKGQLHITTLKYDQSTKSGPLVSKFLEKVLTTIKINNVSENEEIINKIATRHCQILREISELRNERKVPNYEHYEVKNLPLQLMICVKNDSNDHEKYKYDALTIFNGTYNMELIQDIRSMTTSDPQLVETFVSMYESISDEKSTTT